MIESAEVSCGVEFIVAEDVRCFCEVAAWRRGGVLGWVCRVGVMSSCYEESGLGLILKTKRVHLYFSNGPMTPQPLFLEWVGAARWLEVFAVQTFYFMRSI